MAPLDEVQVGDLVNVPGAMYGTVRYLGTVAGKPGKFAGIELAAEHAPRGKNNGDVDGRKYFITSTPGSGIFVPMNNSKYVTKRNSNSTPAAPQTPTRPSANFSKSVGPTASVSRPKVTPRRPSQPRPDSPRTATQPLKMSLSGLRTPSASNKTGPAPAAFPRSPVKTPSRASDRPSSRVSAEDELPPPRFSDVKRDSTSSEVQDLKDQVKNLEGQLRDRDSQLDEQSNLLTEFQKTLEELEGSDALAVRAQLREKNDKISQLTTEFDTHRADFRSTLDTLEIAASETERVYEQRLDELMQQNRELHDRGEDVEVVAQQLKQLEELVSELEEGLEDARRGEAEARAEVEFLRGEVERTKLELKKERDNSTAALKDAQAANGDQQPKGLDQKDDEIRGLKAIIHSLSKGDPNFPGLQNGLSASFRQGHDSERVNQLEQRIQEYEDVADTKAYRIEELERELRQLQLNGAGRRRDSTAATPARPRQLSNSSGNVNPPSHVRRLSDRTVVPADWEDQPVNDHQYQPLQPRRRGLSEATRQRLETMHEADSHTSDDGNSLWCEICETAGHDILHCTSMFGAEMKQGAPSNGQPDQSPAVEKPTPGNTSSENLGHSASFGSHGSAAAQKTGRDAVAEGLKGIGDITSSMAPVAGKSSGVVDESKWCALCERDGHESIDCPFDE